MGKLTRSTNKKIAGVCAGLAEHFGFDTTIVRIIFLILLFVTFSAAGIAYLILMVLMPVADGNGASNYKERMNERLNK